MIPYNEPFHMAYTGPAVKEDWHEAERTVGDDDAWIVWPARIERDVVQSGLSYEASLAKHRREWRQALGLPVPPLPPVPELPRLHTDGILFRNELSRIVRWREFGAFRWYKFWLDGRDLTPYMQQARDVGADQIHVLGVHTMNSAFKATWLDPRIYGERYWEQIDPFLDFCATFGLSVGWTALTDLQDSPTRLNVRVPLAREWVSRLAPILARHPGAVLKMSLEPQFNGIDPADYMDLARIPGLLVTSGNYEYGYKLGDPPLSNVRDFIVVHDSRDDEWPRKGKDAMRELGVEGYNGHPPHRVPVVGDEPMGADEVGESGRRSNVPADFRDYARVESLFGAGATFHSQASVSGTLLGPRQELCARAFFDGMDDIPLEAPLWHYTRAGLDDSPIEGVNELRAYAMIDGSQAVSVIVRKAYAGPPPTRNGWRIVSMTPDTGVVFLER